LRTSETVIQSTDTTIAKQWSTKQYRRLKIEATWSYFKKKGWTRVFQKVCGTCLNSGTMVLLVGIDVMNRTSVTDIP